MKSGLDAKPLFLQVDMLRSENSSSWELFPWASSHKVKPKQAADNDRTSRRGLHRTYVCDVVIKGQLSVYWFGW